VRNSSYVVGLSYMALCATAVALSRRPVELQATPRHAPVAPVPAEAPIDDAAAWFTAVKPFCNTVEVETALTQRPAPDGTLGAGYGAACLALGGKIDRARAVLAALPADQRWRAAGVVFEIAHPVADAGDDRSAGPIMALVTEFWPNHHMALYHAGASEFAVGDFDAARRHLKAFMDQYQPEDGWRANARQLLERIGAGAR
jgi:hypothetical protein